MIVFNTSTDCAKGAKTLSYTNVFDVTNIRGPITCTIFYEIDQSARVSNKNGVIWDMSKGPYYYLSESGPKLGPYESYIIGKLLMRRVKVLLGASLNFTC